ncbi:cysteine ABC transporter permease [Raoultella ornithinolytica]|nr:cysteine ABC transporter permease [Raoultella ornithinolytica]
MPEFISLAISSFWPMLYAGLVFTIPITLISFSLGLLLGFIVALIRLYGLRR